MNIPTTVAICVATYLRPKRLGELLDSLRVLDVEGLNVHLIIADNDASGSAQPVVQERTADFPYPVTYVVEPARGLAFVRNRLFAEAYALDVEFIASIDDDATADRMWLQELIATADAYTADAVSGHTDYWIDYELPSSVRNTIFREKMKTGTFTRRISTQNALYRCSAVARISGPFDPQFNFTGGEDGALSQSLLNHNCKLVTASAAVVREYLPRSRTTLRELLTRAYTNGVNETRFLLLSSPSTKQVGNSLFWSLARFVVGSIQVPLSIARKKDSTLTYGTRAASGLGGILGFITVRAGARTYKTVHGG